MDIEARKLIGRWTTDPADANAIEKYGRTTLVFGEDFRLAYIIHGDIKDDVIVMTFRIEDSILITDQPSQPGEERTAFTITPEGKLLLNYCGLQSHYVRSS